MISRYLIALIVMLFVSGCSSTTSNQRPSNPIKAAEINAELGLRYMVAGNYELAMQKLTKSLSFDEDSVDAHHYLAELYRRLNQIDKADKHYQLAIDNSDNDSSLYNNYGVFLCSQGRIDDAEELFSKVLDNPLYSERAQVYENLGLCMEQQKDYEKAESYFREALKHNEKLPGTLLAMARISFENSKWLSSRAYLQRLKLITEHNAESLWLACRVENILGDKSAAKKFGDELVSKYPQSNEASEYQKLDI